MPYPKWIFTFTLLLIISVPTLAQDATTSPAGEKLPDNLVVAWIENGNLFARMGNKPPVQLVTNNNPVFPYVSPDGLYVAYLYGEGDILSGLSVINLAENNSRQLITAKNLSAGEDNSILISQIDWLDDTLYFNTAAQTSFGQDRRDDLWRVDIQTGDVTMLLPPGEGGAFSFSPDHKWITVISAGTYDHENAHLYLMNVETGDTQDMLSFPAVSTGSEYTFYPEIFWQADSAAFRVTIPDKDLIYDEANKSAALWKVAVNGASEKIGLVSASFFGLPRWSDDGQYMVYLSRAGELTSNQFDLYRADGHGSNPIKYASGEAGSLGVSIWIPNSTQFIYAQGEPGNYWLGSPDTQSVPIAEQMFNPVFLEGGQIVYVSTLASPSELRYRQVGTNQSVLITTVENQIPIFDAVITL